MSKNRLCLAPLSAIKIEDIFKKTMEEAFWSWTLLLGEPFSRVKQNESQPKNIPIFGYWNIGIYVRPTKIWPFTVLCDFTHTFTSPNQIHLSLDFILQWKMGSHISFVPYCCSQLCVLGILVHWFISCLFFFARIFSLTILFFSIWIVIL